MEEFLNEISEQFIQGKYQNNLRKSKQTQIKYWSLKKINY